jgi:hypothetical protein
VAVRRERNGGPRDILVPDVTLVTERRRGKGVSCPAPLKASGGIVATGSGNRDKIEFWREEVLRRAEQALQGRLVGLWQYSEGGQLVPLAVGAKRQLPPTASGEITRALNGWHVPIDPHSRWLAARLDMGRWCIAPVRCDVPGPPPGGIERRKKERMMLELAGLCLGLIEERFAGEPSAEPPAEKRA